MALADSGRGADALRVFDRVLALDPENAEAYGNTGVVRLRGNDAAGARDVFRKALAIDPQFPRAWNGLGVALARLGDERAAIDCWEKAVARDPKLYDALFNLGLTAARNGLKEQSRRALERFVATAPPALYRDDIAKARVFLKALARTLSPSGSGGARGVSPRLTSAPAVAEGHAPRSGGRQGEGHP